MTITIASLITLIVKFAIASAIVCWIFSLLIRSVWAVADFAGDHQELFNKIITIVWVTIFLWINFLIFMTTK